VDQNSAASLLLLAGVPLKPQMVVNTRSHLINVVATPLWGVCIFGVGRSGRRTARGYGASEFMRRLLGFGLVRRVSSFSV
jgi:hypothetical protein